MVEILNICVGHQQFPPEYQHYVDYTLSPFLVPIAKRLVIVPDNTFGSSGSSLSEYAQLFWLYRNLDQVLHGETYIRTFQYRRFVSDGEAQIGEACSLPFAKFIKQDQLKYFHRDFLRSGTMEVINTPVRCADSIMGQYNSTHVLEDLLDFFSFICKENILSRSVVSKFMREEILVPASSISVLSVEHFKRIFSVLFEAGKFMSRPNFISRSGYQRRNMGFMLERLHSCLLWELFLESNRSGNQALKTGVHMVISETPQIPHTVLLSNQD